MAEIGETLREARMGAGIDVSEIEAQTKIRAKYLRALENEEWGLLPGNTYVKSFLRTYAEALGLDPKLLVEEYKLRHERLSEMEMQPIVATPSGGERATRVGRSVPRGWLIGGVAVALVVVLGLLGLASRKTSTFSGARPPRPAPGRPTGPATGPGAVPIHHPAVKLQIIPTSQVYVCLTSAQGRKLIAGQTLTPGSRTRVYRSRRFLLTLGNSSARLKIDGRVQSLPASANPISLSIGPRGSRPLAASRAPTCA
jgi:transcriptional regulator with XRE-family HTH domain